MKIYWIDNYVKDKLIIDEILLSFHGKVALINRKFPLISNLSVLENIILPASYYSDNKYLFFKDRVAEYLNRFEMLQKMHSRQNELSKFENFVVRFLQAYFSPFEKIIAVNELYEFHDNERISIFQFLKAEKSDNVLFMEYNRYKDIYEGIEYQNIEDYKNWLIQDLKT
jgi:ABC-type lipoprotein export system ATPase subunit